MMFQFFIIIAIINIMAIVLAGKYKLLPIIMQLLIAVLVVPALNYIYFHIGYNIPLELKAVNYTFLEHFYKFNFALILGLILIETLEDKFELSHIKIAIPSFLLPFIVGVLTAYFYFNNYNTLQSISLGLLFAITAVPVLYILLKNMGYSQTEMKKLLQTAIVIDLTCWLIFGLAKDYQALTSNLLIILLGLMPIFLRFFVHIFRINKQNRAYVYGITFFGMILILEYYKYNILLFGMTYVLLSQYLKIKIALPIKKQLIDSYQKWVAIPFILTIGMLQVNMTSVFQDFALKDLLLIFMPILVKIGANYIGLSWYDISENFKTKCVYSILLNTRGLTEIIFLNMLLSENIIDQKVYVLIMIMGLISTLLPLFIKKGKNE